MTSALTKLNRGKTVESDGIVIEMLTDLDDFAIDKITEIINEIHKLQKTLVEPFL